MSDLDRGLRQLVEEGARAARRPPFAQLKSRARQRRRIRAAATVTAAAAAVTAMAVAVLPLSRSGAAVQGATATSSPGPTATGPLRALIASPSETIPGGTITLDGTGCAPGEEVLIEIRWDRGAKMLSPADEGKKGQGQPGTTATAGGRNKLATVAARTDGSFTSRITVPVNMMINEPGLWTQCLKPASAQTLVQHVSILVRRS
ncbi:hypothetical protein OG601_38350 [Streptomyces sp. NBC_01239]|uniref:hypothetical protein n=1 Tax=Streptomyces sp. NBC_01239 TaxID=2903792 RepID=UPI002257E949|nr:hypothetical protein [Streptomyces sp. NBC_01239]MCX4816471.1 hypothetical protein [Streptomyces sp. NBC_01239]